MHTDITNPQLEVILLALLAKKVSSHLMDSALPNIMHALTESLIQRYD